MPSRLYWYGDVPPLACAVSWPLIFPLPTIDWEIYPLVTSGLGLTIGAASVAWHPLPSVIVTLYVPDDKELISSDKDVYPFGPVHR